MFKKFLIMTLVISLFFLVSCSSDNKEIESKQSDGQKKEANMEEKQKEESNDNATNWKEKLTANEVPTTIEEVFSTPPGKFADMNYEDNKNDKKIMLESFLKLPEVKDANNIEKINAFWNELVALTFASYPDINNLKTKIKSMGYGSPEIKDPRYQFKESLNVEIILDASGSMAANVDGKSKMEIAKETIKSFVEELPDKARIGLRIYGHKGTGSDSDKSLSCGSTELVYEISEYNKVKFSKAMNKFSPAGWTPIALALEEAKQDLLNYPANNNTNIIYLVSDGIGTCDRNPVEIAKKLPASKINPIVNVIGFDVDAKGTNQLEDIAKAAAGTYSSVNSESELKNELDRAEKLADKWRAWKGDALTEVVYQHSENRGNINQFSVDFVRDFIQQSKNMEGILDDLAENNHISEEVFEILDDKRSEWYDMMGELDDKVEQNLYDMEEKVVKALEEAINDKYKNR